MPAPTGQPPRLLDRLLDAIERAGNRLPHPTALFIWLGALVLIGSWLAATVELSAVHPVTGATIESVNLLSGAGIRRVLTGVVSNFTSFAPLGTVLVAMLGIGIAERSGLLGALLRQMVRLAPARLLTMFVVLAGVLSSLAADAGYVVLIPLAALAFIQANRHPLAGIAAAFAGVSGGYSANLMIGGLDAILGGLSTSAAQLVDPAYEVGAAANYYFIAVSTLLVTIVGSLVTERLVEPRLGAYAGQPSDADTASQGSGSDAPPAAPETAGPSADGSTTASALAPSTARPYWGVALLSVAFVALLLLAVVPESGILRDPATGGIVRSPFISGIVVIITLYFALAGLVWGYLTGSFQQPGMGRNPIIGAMESTMATMAGYLVLMFFAAQFVAWFGWTNLGLIAAVKGSALLGALDLGPIVILLLFILLAASINLFIGSASAKWGIMGPVFIPMLMLLGISPEATQMAYRIGDSSTNIITPLMPYLALVVAFAQRYEPRAGVGSIIAMMVPYSVAFLMMWSLLLVAWMLSGLPLGPGAGWTYQP